MLALATMSNAVGGCHPTFDGPGKAKLCSRDRVYLSHIAPAGAAPEIDERPRQKAGGH